MKKIFTSEDEKVHIWKNLKGETITAVKAEERSGKFWTVKYENNDEKKVLCTRCKWNKVIEYVTEYADSKDYKYNDAVCRFAEDLMEIFREKNEEYKKAGNFDKAASYFSCMQITDHLLYGRRRLKY